MQEADDVTEEIFQRLQKIYGISSWMQGNLDACQGQGGIVYLCMHDRYWQGAYGPYPWKHHRRPSFAL